MECAHNGDTEMLLTSVTTSDKKLKTADLNHMNVNVIPVVNNNKNLESSKVPSSTSKVYQHSENVGFFQLQRYNRSKSLSYLASECYSSGEVRRIREHFLRMNPRVNRGHQSLKYMSRRQKLTLASLAIVDFMSFCSMSVMAPFFPREAAEKGLSDTLSGFVFSFYAFIMFITSPMFGKILPKVGARFLFLNGMLITGICNLLFGTMEYVQDYTTFTTLCIILRGFGAVGASAFSTSSFVFVINSFPHNIGAVIGILETFVGLGMSTGPALGGLLYSVGGFSLPFFVLGIAMIITVVGNLFLLPVVDDGNFSRKSTSICRLLKIPSILATSLVVVVVSSTWSFMDPTLEPHLRQFNLSPEHIGLIFLLFSAIYGIFSPFWGYVADRLHNHWSMMVFGLVLTTLGLLLLGPCPYIYILTSSLWLNLVALSLLGVSVALALLPTFQGILINAVEAGCSDSLATYSVVAGIWSCMYSLGEVIGPSLGGILLQYYGFPITATVMAVITFISAIILFGYYQLRNMCCLSLTAPILQSDSGIIFDSSWSTSSLRFSPTSSTSNSRVTESSPLLMASTLVSTSPANYFEKNAPRRFYNNLQQSDTAVNQHHQQDISTSIITLTAKGSCEI